MLAFPALAIPLAGQLHLDVGRVLGISFWMYMLFGLSALPWGMAADRWGARRLLLLYHSGAALSSLAAAGCTRSPERLAAALAALGFFSGVYHPAGLGWLSREIKRTSVGLAWNGIFGNLGMAAAPLLTGLAVWLSGVRAAFLLLAALNIFGAALVAACPREGAPAAQQPDQGGGTCRTGAFCILLAAMMLGGFAYRGSTVILPAYFELQNRQIFQWLISHTSGGISPNLVATASASIVYAAGMLGQYAGGRAAERRDLRICYLAFHAAAVPVAWLMSVAADVPLMLLAMAYFFFLLGIQPVENTLVARLTPAKLRHSAYGAKFILTFGIGAVAVKTVEALEIRSGPGSIFVMLAGVSLLLTGVISTLIRATRASWK